MLRRDFIKTTCVTCAGVIGAGTLISTLNSCTALPVLKTTETENKITVPKSSFIDPQNLLILKSSNLEFDILLIKKKDNTYNALYMQCTHHSQPLSATKSGLFCSAHGSAFNLEGEVTIQPAINPLKKFKTDIQNNNIIIYLTA